jgi:hypothetical protein
MNEVQLFGNFTSKDKNNEEFDSNFNFNLTVDFNILRSNLRGRQFERCKLKFFKFPAQIKSFKFKIKIPRFNCCKNTDTQLKSTGTRRLMATIWGSIVARVVLCHRHRPVSQ